MARIYRNELGEVVLEGFRFTTENVGSEYIHVEGVAVTLVECEVECSLSLNGKSVLTRKGQPPPNPHETSDVSLRVRASRNNGVPVELPGYGNFRDGKPD